MNDILIHLFEVPKEIYEQIFKDKGKLEKKKYGQLETRVYKYNFNLLTVIENIKNLFVNKELKKAETMKWIGYNFPKLTDNNISIIFQDLIESFNKSNNKKNIIIKFGNNYLKPFRLLCNKFVTDIPFVLFNFSENDEFENGFFDKFKSPQYISYIKDKKDSDNPDLNLHKIISYIWEKDCYYNERGNFLCRYSPANLLYKPSQGFIFFNILLIGESRAGKSTFINRMFNKFVAYETGKFESATQDINCYEFYLQDYAGDDGNKLIKNGNGIIRLLDTPGIVITKDLDASSKIINTIEKELDNIHLIYFFMKAQGNIEQSINILKYIKKKNSDKNKKFKIPIIFVKNGEDLIPGGSGQLLFQELKNILQKHDLLELYDSFGNNNEKISDKNSFLADEEEEENINDYQKYIDGNIIQIHLPTGKNLNNLFLISKHYFLKNNSLIVEGKLDNEFNIMSKNVKALIEFYKKEKLDGKSLTNKEKDLYNKLYNDCNEFVLKLQNNSSILFNLDILRIKNKTNYIIFSTLAWVSLPFFTVTFGISLIYTFLFIKRANKNMISNIASSYGFNENDINSYGLNEYIFKGEIMDEKNKEKSIEKIKTFFENIIYYIGPIQCALKAKETLIQINETFDKLSNKKSDEWNKFKVNKI